MVRLRQFSGGDVVYERFTDRARKVMQLANQEAQRFNHEYIGTEHILLGLVQEGSGVAANVLKNLDVNLRMLREEAEKIVTPGPAGGEPSPGRLPHEPRARKVIEQAIQAARELNHNYVGTEHVLLGLLREPECAGARVLTNLGLKLEGVHQELLNIVGHQPLPGELEALPHRIATAPGSDPAPAGRPRYRSRARKAMQFADREAQRFNHEYIGTEHILLGLIREGDNAAIAALKALGIEPRWVRREVERIFQPGPAGDLVETDRRPQTPRAKKVIEYAVEEAQASGEDRVGCGHLLLGLIREGEGVAGQVLANLGATPERVRAAPLDLEPTGPGPDERPADALPAEFAPLDAVIAKLSAVSERAVAANKFVEAVWFAEQIELLKQVRAAILRRFGE
jgi:ATP-dependent Clp protease ATP-binding subunit ClpA